MSTGTQTKPRGGGSIDVRYVNPFIEAIDNVFTTMLDLKPQRQTLRICPSEATGPQLTSIIGISGHIHGVVALRFPPDAAKALAGRFTGIVPTEVNDEVIDAVAELVNMVAGNAKAKLDMDPPLQLGLPTVVEGTGYRLKYPTGAAWLEVPFESEAGSFCMEITYSAE
ncbi:MAG: chemotaxis protein CheX [Phycisphaerae bacterium]|nr:chemotaxis protein CheX [Phycisphaerae bacterium]